MFGKLVYSCAVAIIAAYFCEKLYAKIQTHRSTVNVNLENFVDSSWTQDFKAYILDYLTEWENETFSPEIAKCSSLCSKEWAMPDSMHFGSQCKTFPLILLDEHVNEEKINRSNKTYAELTTPCFMKISLSKIPGANRGVYTKVDLPRGLVFGPYTGTIKSAYGAEGDDARSGGYAWRVNRQNEAEEEDDFYVDGIHENNSNWMRYVNAARFEEEQNIYVLIFNDSVYYLTFKDVPAGEELLTWYGKNYAWWLGIEAMNNSDHDWESDLAPKRSIVICDSCDRSRKSLNMPSLHEEQEAEEEKESSYGDDEASSTVSDEEVQHEQPVLEYTEPTIDQKIDDNVVVTSQEVDAQNVVV